MGLALLASDGAGGPASAGRGGKPDDRIGAALIDGSSSAGGGEIDANRSWGGDIVFDALPMVGGRGAAELALANPCESQLGLATWCGAKPPAAARS